MRMLVPAAVLALVTLSGCALPDAPKEDDPDGFLFPLPPRDVAAGTFEKWQQEAAKKPSNVAYTRVEFDKNAYWVAEAHFGWGAPSKKIAVYAPTKDGAFRRCLLAGPMKAWELAVTVDAKTGMLELREQANIGTVTADQKTKIKGEVVLSCNLKTIGVLP